MTCRDEILACIDQIERTTGRREFTPDEVVTRMREAGTKYEDRTIRTHIISRLCTTAPANHATRYPDLVRVSEGVYARRRLPPTFQPADSLRSDPARPGPAFTPP